MDYKEKYEQALKKAKAYDNVREKIAIRFGSNVAKEIFSEYEENEDEKIRKGLIDFLKSPFVNENITDEKVTPWIAWLEKQCTKEPKKTSIWKHWKDGIAGNGDGKPIYLIKNGNDYSISSCLGFECDYIKLSDLDKLMLSEKHDGHKPDDKVEPKFHAGDFITDGERIFKIKETIWERNNRNDGITYCESLIVNLRDGNTYADNTDLKKYHLWTIQDAEDGDVLVTLNYIYIFNSIDKETETVGYYCLMKKLDKCFSFGGYKIHDEILNSVPATKEQRDLLFQKMKEAGYEWDAEKKELKKIEQKPADKKYTFNAIPRLLSMIQPTDRAKAYCQKLIDILIQEGYSADAKIVGNCLKQMNGEKIAMATMDKHEPSRPSNLDEAANSYYENDCPYDGEARVVNREHDVWFPSQAIEDAFKAGAEWMAGQKPAWSEEDEEMFDAIITDIQFTQKAHTHEVNQVVYEREIDWLKSLKERMKGE